MYSMTVFCKHLFLPLNFQQKNLSVLINNKSMVRQLKSMEHLYIRIKSHTPFIPNKNKKNHNEDRELLVTAHVW